MALRIPDPAPGSRCSLEPYFDGCSLGSAWVIRIVLAGSGSIWRSIVVHLAAFAQGLVGAASVPSAGVLVLLGVLCFVAVARDHCR